MNVETRSVIDFLNSNQNIVEYYFFLLRSKNNKNISYSDLLISVKLEGTTKEGVDFNSSKVSRSRVSDHLKSMWKARGFKR